ncbi:HEAT repeat domain-containing protein [Anatilimnocola floriformis]|uniref:HEAT repeat domain-containing protein n=1 Tax=Anatilimnocola floriformis TaxID=2948575 RepID=UPI0020C3E048|nr:HEAT repeat domain-containing protein [Anatilimnocola floriformis]
MNPFLRAAVLAVLTYGLISSLRADEPENVATVSAKLNSDDPSVQWDGLSDLVVSHEGLVGCLPALVKLAHRDSEWRVDALVKIGRFDRRARGTGPQIADLLEHANVDIRIAAADAILRIEKKNEPSVKTLVGALRAENALRRKSAVEALSYHSRVSQSALPALLAAVNDPEKDVRAEVATALGEIASPTSTEVFATLQKLLDDKDPWVRGHAAAALWQLDEPAEALLPTLTKLVKEYEVDPRRDVIQDIWGHDAGIKLIQKIGSAAEAAVPALTAALDSPQTGERLAAADALAAIGPAAAPAIDRLSKSLRDTQGHTFVFAHRAWFVSDQAAIALGKIGPAARPKLFAALEDPDERVRSLAASQLATMPPDNETVAALQKLLRDKSVPVQASAAFHLGKLGPRAKVAVPELVNLLNEKGDWTSFPGGGIGTTYSLADHAAAALQELKPSVAEVVPTLVEMLRKDQRLEPALQRYLRELGPAAKDVIPLLEPRLKKAEERMNIALVLTRVAPDHPGLLDLLQDHFDRNNNIETFAQAVGELEPRGRAALPRLRRALEKDGEYLEVRSAIAPALVRIDPDDSSAVVLLAEVLQADRWNRLDPGAKDAWRALGNKRVAAEAKLLAGLTAVGTEPTDSAYFRDVLEKEARLRSALLLHDLGTQEPAVVKALIALCGCDGCSVRGEAADALGEIGSAAASAATTLVKLLDDEDQYTVDGDFYGNVGTKHLPGDHARDALSRIGTPAIPALQTALKSDSRTIRRRAAEAIGNMGTAGQAAGDDLLRALRDPHQAIRAAAARGLGQLGEARPATIEALTTAVADKHLAVRLAAQESRAALTKIRN